MQSHVYHGLSRYMILIGWKVCIKTIYCTGSLGQVYCNHHSKFIPYLALRDPSPEDPCPSLMKRNGSVIGLKRFFIDHNFVIGIRLEENIFVLH